MERQSVFLLFDQKLNCVLMRKQRMAPRTGICALLGATAGENVDTALETLTGFNADQVGLAHLTVLEGVCDIYVGRSEGEPTRTGCVWMPIESFRAWCKSRNIGQLSQLADYALELMKTNI